MSDLRLPISDLRPPISAPCLFVGALDYDANVDGVSWFCREIWPRVRQSHPDAEFRLVGSRPGPAAQRLGRLPGVNLVGEVPDVRPHLREAALVVVPLRVARGIQNKVLEALAMGKAVVATPPALEGIGLEPDVHARQAATADQWVRIVGELLSDPAQCIRLGVAGRKFVETQFHWEVRLQPLASIPVLRGCWASGPPDGSSCSHDDRDPGSSPAPV